MGWEGSSSQRQKGNIVTINGRDTALQGAEETIAQQRSDQGSWSLQRSFYRGMGFAGSWGRDTTLSFEGSGHGLAVRLKGLHSKVVLPKWLEGWPRVKTMWHTWPLPQWRQQQQQQQPSMPALLSACLHMTTMTMTLSQHQYTYPPACTWPPPPPLSHHLTTHTCLPTCMQSPSPPTPTCFLL